MLNPYMGYVGIGTINPIAKLDVRIPTQANSIVAMFKNIDDDGIFIVPKLDDAGYNYHSVAGDVGIFWDGYSPSAGLVIGPWQSGMWAGMRITHDGKVGIGIKDPLYKLDVCGKIRAQEVIVEATGCDFVFDESYNLVPLKVRKSIVLNQKHLFNVASAKEMQQGASMGITMMGILRNVEEHEQYLYQHDDEIEKLKEENALMKTELDNLKKIVENLINTKTK